MSNSDCYTTNSVVESTSDPVKLGDEPLSHDLDVTLPAPEDAPAPTPEDDSDDDHVPPPPQISVPKRIYMLSEAPIARALLFVTWPAFLSQVSAGLYQMVDSAFIGKLAGSDALAALTLGVPLDYTYCALLMIAGTGAAVTYGRAVGRNDRAAAKAACGGSLLISLIVAVLLTAVMAPLAPKILYLLGARNENNTLPNAVAYSGTILYGSIIPAIAFTYTNLLRGEGSVAVSCLCAVVAAVVNCGVDPALMLLFRKIPNTLTVTGAALATMFGWVLQGLGGIIWYHCLKRGQVRFGFKHMKWSPQAKEILIVGIGTAFNQLSSAICTIVSNKMVLNYSEYTQGTTDMNLAVAAVGCINRVFNMCYMICYSASQGLNPITAFTVGAGMGRRFRSALIATYTWVVPVMCVLTVIMEVAAPQIAHLFGDEELYVQIFTKALRISAPSVIGFSVAIAIYPALQAIGKGALAGLIISLPNFICYLPIQLILSMTTKSIYAVPISIVSANFLAIVPVGIIVYINRKKLYLAGELPPDPVYVPADVPAKTQENAQTQELVTVEGNDVVEI